MKKLDLTKGSVTKNILKLAWPMMIAMFLQTMFNVVDRIYLGRYSTEAIAAVGITFPVIFLIISLSTGIGVGLTSLISRRLGAKRYKEADNAAEHGILLGIVMAILFTIFGLALSKPLFAYVGADDAIMPLVLEYAKIIFGGSIFMFMSFIANSILRGEGNMKIPMIVMMIATITNIILDPAFIFGFWFIPEMGVAGAALATVISRSLAALFGLSYLFSGKTFLRLRLRAFKFSTKIIRDILKVGVPASLSQSMMSIGMFFMVKFVTTFGTGVIAAFTIVGSLDSVAVLPIIGIASATVTVVGFNVGAGNIKRAKSSAWKASWLGLLFGTGIGIIYFIIPSVFINIFSTDAAIIGIGIEYLKILALFSGYSAITIVLSSGFQGSGRGSPTLILTILRLFVFMLPFAYIFGIMLGYGRTLVFWAFPFSGVLTATIAMIWFKYAKLEKKKLADVPVIGG